MSRTILFWLAGVLCLALGLELLFRVLPVSTATETGYYTDPMILNYPPHHRWTDSTGWDLRNAQKLEANNLGYVAHRDFVPDPHAVALIGDSFVEASMLATIDRPGTQLERELGGRPVYAMGAPGTALLDYAERIRFAHEKFGIRDFVVLMERGDVKQSLCGSGNINGPCLDPQTLEPRISKIPPPGTAKRIFRHSALAQYLFGQLKFNPERLWQQALAPTHPSAPVHRVTATSHLLPVVDAVTKAFFERVKPYVAGQLVIVVDSDRGALNSGRSTIDPARDRFIALARAAGATVVDTKPLYRAQLAQSTLLLDVGPYDGHLNKLGVAIAMKSAAMALSR